ncbi:MAG: penicillin acylase family protein [Proteobacteria bacterium]|nr:penicillin acylase family protein [Pseudomonadota bacterium]
MRLSLVRGTVPLSALALACAALVAACGGGSSNNSGGGTPTTPGTGGDPQLSYKADIRRTGMGVPHIKADNWGGAGYGYGYAQAQDDLCTMANSFLTYRGERSLNFGADTLIPFSSTIGRPKNIDSDFFHRHVLNDEVVKTMVAAQPDTIRELVAGFAAGYNRYVREIKAGGDAGAHAACRTEAWVAPVTSDDIFRRMYAANFAGGYSNFLPNIANAIAPAASAPTVAMLRRQRALQADGTQLASASLQMPEFQVGGQEGVGSNMFGFGTAATGDGSPLLFGNPHWYWRGPDRFYQAQLTIPGQLNVSGTSFLGIPVILIGFNDNVAWSHTVSTARRFGFFQLTLASGDPTSYMVDGQAVKMKPRSITVQVKQSGGGISPVTRTLYDSEYGPMVNLGVVNPALAWSQTTAFAIRDINGENFRLFRNWQRWNQAKSLDEFITIQRQEAAIPWVNTVAVGRGSSQAWYADIGAIPNAPGSSCNSPYAAALAGALPRVPVLDGSKSACNWQSDADSVQKGAIGPARLPSLVRDDYVANMNDSYWLSNPAQPLTGFPAIMGPAGTEAVSFRTRLGNLLAQGRLAGTDGYGGKFATSDAVRKMVINSRVHTAELFKDATLNMVCAAGPITVSGQSVDPTAACAVLSAWDNTGVRTARGALLWDEFWTRASKTANLYAVPFNAADPIHTPRDLKTDGSITPAIQQAFGAAVLAVQASGYALDAQRGDYLYATRGGQKIGLFGGCGGQGYFTVACSEQTLAQGSYNMDNDPNGNSYMQVVRFPDGGVDAYTFLTFSLSDDPASAHNADYTRAYSEGQWQKMPFSEGEISADPALKLTRISE